jgi:hypothetical protein
MVAAWYVGLTALALAFAYRGRGLGRPPGAVIITGYLAFVSALAITITQARVSPAAAAVPAAVITLAGTILVARHWRGARQRPGGPPGGSGDPCCPDGTPAACGR